MSELPVSALLRGMWGTEVFFSPLNKCSPRLNIGISHPRGHSLDNEQGELLPLLAYAQHLQSAAAVSRLSAWDPKSRVATECSPESWPVPVLDLYIPLLPFPMWVTPPRPSSLLTKKWFSWSSEATILHFFSNNRKKRRQVMKGQE